MVDAKHKFHTL